MPFTTAICNQILNFYLGRATATGFAAYNYLYVGLFKNNPEDARGDYEELEGKGYERVHILSRDNVSYPNYLTVAGDEDLGDSGNRTVYNKNEIHFKKATDDWDTVYGFGIFGVNDQTKAQGNEAVLIYYAKLDGDEGVTVRKDGVALFDPEKLKIRFSDTDKAEDEGTQQGQ